MKHSDLPRWNPVNNTAQKYSPDSHRLSGGGGTWQTAGYIRDQGIRQFKAGQSGSGLEGSLFRDTTFPFPVFLPSVDSNEALFSLEPTSICRLSRGLPPCASPPMEPNYPQLTVCVRTHSPSASTKGSGTWWSYTGGSPDRPWRLPPSGLFPAPASVSATANLKPLGSEAKQVPTNKL